MKKRLGLAMLVSALCLVAVGTARAAVDANERIPVVMDVFVPCANGGAGESVHFEGTLHVLATFTVNGNHISGSLHFQPQGLTGVGAVSGDIYRAVGITRQSIDENLVNGQASETYINNFRVIVKGPGNNFLVHENFHVTFNAQGILSALVDNFSIDCK